MGSGALDETFSDISIHQSNKKSNTSNKNSSEKFDNRLALPEVDANNSSNLKSSQLEIIQKSNPMRDEYHTGIRSTDDIKTFKEASADPESFTWDALHSLPLQKRRLYKTAA